MNKKNLVISTMMVAMLGASASGFAQDRHNDRGDRNDRGPDRHEQRDNRDNRDNNRGNDRHDNRGNDYRGNDRRDRDDRAYHGRDNARWNGAGPDHNFRRGERLPDRYRNNQYVVNDWRGHKLRQPPRGYHWVQTGGDYVLAAIATGLIADLIINH